MQDQHPTEVHEYVLKDHSNRLTELEVAMQDVQNWRSANDEKTKTLFTMLAELKAMLSQYTADMRAAMADLAAKMEARFIVIDKEIGDTKMRPGKRAEEWIEKAFFILMAAAVGYLSARLRGGTPPTP